MQIIVFQLIDVPIYSINCVHSCNVLLVTTPQISTTGVDNISQWIFTLDLLGDTKQLGSRLRDILLAQSIMLS